MIVLGIETSCDETSVSVLRAPRRILSNVVYSSFKEHKRFGGVVPEIASRAHLEAIVPCLQAALKKAKIQLEAIDLIAVVEAPPPAMTLWFGFSPAAYDHQS